MNACITGRGHRYASDPRVLLRLLQGEVDSYLYPSCHFARGIHNPGVYRPHRTTDCGLLCLFPSHDGSKFTVVLIDPQGTDQPHSGIRSIRVGGHMV